MSAFDLPGSLGVSSGPLVVLDHADQAGTEPNVPGPCRTRQERDGGCGDERLGLAWGLGPSYPGGSFRPVSIVLELRKRRVTANARQHAQGKLEDKYLTNPRELVKPIVRTTKPLSLCHIQTDPAERLTPLSTWHSVQRNQPLGWGAAATL